MVHFGVGDSIPCRLSQFLAPSWTAITASLSPQSGGKAVENRLNNCQKLRQHWLCRPMLKE